MTRPVFRTFDRQQAYAPTIEAMAAHAAGIRAGTTGEEVWLLEHAPVLTGGTSAQDTDLVDTGGIDVHRSGRGGQWTWHGPGQRVAYVMLDLGARNPDVRAYVQALEAWIIDTLASFGVTGQRRDGHPGIWVAGDGQLDKIAAIGVRISRWVSWHGIAINLDPDLSAFDRIVPCGVRDGGVTSLAAQGITCDMAQLDTALAAYFERHFPDPPV
jgi:lipoyl(octanoyl) transferase